MAPEFEGDRPDAPPHERANFSDQLGRIRKDIHSRPPGCVFFVLGLLVAMTGGSLIICIGSFFTSAPSSVRSLSGPPSFRGTALNAVPPLKPDFTPEDAVGYSRRAFARIQEGDLDGAIADGTKAIELDPGLSAGYFNRAVARSRQGDQDGAIADYSKVIELDPKSPFAHFNRGTARYQKGDNEGAIADFTKAIEIDSEKSAAYMNRGIAYLTKGNDAAAQKDFELFLKLKPDSKLELEERIKMTKSKR